jgi:hypothetical protein
MPIINGVNYSDDEQAEAANAKIGQTNDTGGNTTAGSVFAKLNALLQKFVSCWTDARAAKLDSLDAAVSSRATQASVTALQTTINNGVGATGDSGGYLTGSAEGKLNNLLFREFFARPFRPSQIVGITYPTVGTSGYSYSISGNEIGGFIVLPINPRAAISSLIVDGVNITNLVGISSPNIDISRLFTSLFSVPYPVPDYSSDYAKYYSHVPYTSSFTIVLASNSNVGHIRITA